MVVSNEIATDRAEYNASNGGGRFVYLPRIKRNVTGSNAGYTGYIVRNVSGTTVTVTAYFYDSVGNLTWTQPTFTLLTEQAAGYSQKDNSNLGSGWNGSVMLVASGNILAVVQENGASSFSAYNGIVR